MKRPPPLFPRTYTLFPHSTLFRSIIHCHAVPHGVNARVDDVAARKVNGPGNSVEKPRMVRGINRDQSRPPIGIDFRGYGERTLPRAQDMPGILAQTFVCLSAPVEFRETLAQRRKFLVWMHKRSLQELPLHPY